LGFIRKNIDIIEGFTGSLPPKKYRRGKNEKYRKTKRNKRTAQASERRLFVSCCKY
jgi:hypothetical protein